MEHPLQAVRRRAGVSSALPVVASTLLVALTALLVVLAPSARVRADEGAGNVRFCNHFARPVFYALAWRQGGIAYSRGWWSADSGQCISVELAVNSFYWRAETDSYRLPSGDNVTTAWGDGGRGFCTETKNFYFKSADGPCRRAPRKGFIRSWTRTDGIPIYLVVTTNGDNTSSQSVEAGHLQLLTPPPAAHIP